MVKFQKTTPYQKDGKYFFYARVMHVCVGNRRLLRNVVDT